MDLLVGGEQRDAGQERGRDDDAIGRVAVVLRQGEAA